MVVAVAVVVRSGSSSSRSSPPPAGPSASRTLGAPGHDRVAAAPAGATRITPQGVVASWVQTENARPGTTTWKLPKPTKSHEIEGYADQVSIDIGGHVALYVSTPAPTFTAVAFRMGYYGGTQARQVWASPATPGRSQASCPVTSGIQMVQCQWVDPLAVQTTAKDWPPGDYLFKLESSDGFGSYIPLTIRDDASHAAYLINNSVTTWEAYNQYGSYSLYAGPSPGGQSLAARSHVVSFDRPYDFGVGTGDFVNQELRMASITESLGLDVSYTTDVDLHANAARLTQHRVFLSLGHDEYYSLAMRDGLQAARDAGVNLVFMGANAVYRHIRLQPSPLGPNRQEIDYRDASLDPLTATDPADSTPAAWRSPPNNRPESSLLGEMWRCNPVSADMVITDPGNWMLAGTGLNAGDHLRDVIGTEYDSFRAADPGPGNVEIVAHSPVNCVGRSDYADLTYYTASSGAGVIDTGSILFIGSVDVVPTPGTPAVQVTQITKNILASFGLGPAGRQHPSMPNTASLPGV